MGSSSSYLIKWKQFTIAWMLFALVLVQRITEVFCLKDLKITVPEAVAAGDTVTLTCTYDLENAALYSVRWYWENEEFYRYIPKESPPAREFSISGIFSVDLTKSNENHVILRSVTRGQSGGYQCEVSADAPLFHTEANVSTMLIAELPKSEPVLNIYGMPGIDSRKIVTIGETFKAGCVSGPSFPPVNFTWSVNGHRYPSTNYGLRTINDANTWESKEVWSELLIHVDNHIVPPYDRKLKVRCETNIYNLYHGTTEIELNVIDDNHWVHGGKVSPTTDQRGGGNRGDPDNSAFTGSAIILTCGSWKYFLLCIISIWLIITMVS